jgi:Ni,Fe-hydrogenase III large subunit
VSANADERTDLLREATDHLSRIADAAEMIADLLNAGVGHEGPTKALMDIREELCRSLP